MTLRKLVNGALLGAAVWVATSSALAQTVSNYAVQVSATVQTNPPQISFSWPADPNATGYQVYRKFLNATSWGTAHTLAVNASNYVDTNVAVGGTYEYWFNKSAASYYGVGYVYAGIQAPLTESRGKVVLIVDATFSASLSNELARLQQDPVVTAGSSCAMTCRAWPWIRPTPVLMSGPPGPTNSPASGSLILADYHADPTNVQSVFIRPRTGAPTPGDIVLDDRHLGSQRRLARRRLLRLDQSNMAGLCGEQHHRQ